MDLLEVDNAETLLARDEEEAFLDWSDEDGGFDPSTLPDPDKHRSSEESESEDIKHEMSDTKKKQGMRKRNNTEVDDVQPRSRHKKKAKWETLEPLDTGLSLAEDEELLRPSAFSRLRSNERSASVQELARLLSAAQAQTVKHRAATASMAFVNVVPKLYRSVIEDVIEGVRDLFAEEGIEEQVLKDLKKLWETKVLQSKATEDFFRNSVHSSMFTLQLPQALPTLQSTAPLLIPAGRPLPSFTPEDLNTPSCGANLAFPGYPIHVPAGVTLQTASGHLYKVNVPVMVTQTSGRTDILQHPFQQVLQQLGQPSIIPSSVPPLHPCSLPAAPEKSHRLDPVLLQPTILHSTPVDRKHLENATTDRRGFPGNEHKTMPEALLRPQESSQYLGLPSVGFAPHVTLAESSLEPVLGVSANMTQNLHGGPFPQGPQDPLHQHMLDGQLPGLKDRMHGCDSGKQLRSTEEPSRPPASEKNATFERDLNIQVIDDDINEIIQIDGTGDNSSTEDVGSIRDVDENEFPGITDAGDLTVLEEEADSVSNEDSTANSSDNEDHQIDTIEEDPLNSEDDVSEQDVPDLFDTENVIVCQYDKIHRSKNRWKFYLKDGVMCFGGRDYVFAKAIGEAEW